ncbi:MAG: DUF927 domain-containing protein [Desulfurococcaceae archaeon]
MQNHNTSSFKSQDNIHALLRAYETYLSVSNYKLAVGLIFLKYLELSKQGVVFVPMLFENDENGSGKINKKPVTPWKNLNIEESENYLKRLKEHYLKETKLRFGLAIRLDDFNEIVVIDIDDIEKFNKFYQLNKFLEDIKEDAFCIVKSLSRGYHIYLPRSHFESVLDKVNNKKLLEEHGFEIKTQGLLVVPPSAFVDKDKEFRTQILYVSFDNVFDKEPGPALKLILNALNAIQEDKEVTQIDETKEEDEVEDIIEEIKKRVRFRDLLTDNFFKDMGKYELYHCPFHLPDKNPSFCVYRNNGFELAIDFHDNETYDIIEFYKKYKNLDFKKAIYELSQIAKIEKAKIEKKKRKKGLSEEFEFIEKGSFVFHGENGEPIGPRLDIVKAIVSENNISYVFYFKNENINEERVFQLETVSDLKEIEKRTGIIITKEQIYKKYINAKIANVKEKEILYKRTGWDEKLENFYHPCLSEQGNWEKWPFHSYFANEKQFYDDYRHLEMIEKALREGKALGFVYLFCFASAIAQKLKIQNLCLFLTGPSGIGKTTLAMLGTNLFYPSAIQFSTFATQTGLELLMKCMSGLPLLLDERAVNLKLDAEQIVFFVSTGKSKIRGTKTLSVNFSQLSNFIIFTSETDEEFKRVGALRRFLRLSFLSREEIFSSEIEVDRLIWGGGVKVLRFFIENFDKFDFESVKQEALDFEELYHVAYAMFASLHIFEKFFNKKFDRMREYVYQVITEHYNQFKKQSNVIEKFLEDFNNFVAKNYSKFLTIHFDENGLPIENEPRFELWGRISQIEKKLYILSVVFTSFLREYCYSNNIVNLLAQQGILVRQKTGKFVVQVRLKEARGYCYVFDLTKLELKDVENKHEEQKQEEQKEQKQEEQKLFDFPKPELPEPEMPEEEKQKEEAKLYIEQKMKQIEEKSKLTEDQLKDICEFW